MKTSRFIIELAKIFAVFLVMLILNSVNSWQDGMIDAQREELNKIKQEVLQIQVDQQETAGEIEHLKSQIEDDMQSDLQSRGKASYYDYTLLEGGWSSKGHRICASRTFPRGATLRVENLANGKTVDCLVTDYGPSEQEFPERVIDLSSFAFSKISDLGRGVIDVNVKEVK